MTNLDKTFIFEIPIECREYSKESCKEDYGSEDNYNEDFPNYVYSMDIMQQIFTDAETHCRFSMMDMLANKKSDRDSGKWEKYEEELYDMWKERIKYYQDLHKKVKCVITEKNMTQKNKFKIEGFLDLDSDFYINCKHNRKRKNIPKCCNSCPIKESIELAERKMKELK